MLGRTDRRSLWKLRGESPVKGLELTKTGTIHKATCVPLRHTLGVQHLRGWTLLILLFNGGGGQKVSFPWNTHFPDLNSFPSPTLYFLSKDFQMFLNYFLKTTIKTNLFISEARWFIMDSENSFLIYFLLFGLLLPCWWNLNLIFVINYN